MDGASLVGGPSLDDITRMSAADINQSLSKVGAGLGLGVGYGTNGGLLPRFVLALKCHAESHGQSDRPRRSLWSRMGFERLCYLPQVLACLLACLRVCVCVRARARELASLCENLHGRVCLWFYLVYFAIVATRMLQHFSIITLRIRKDEHSTKYRNLIVRFKTIIFRPLLVQFLR